MAVGFLKILTKKYIFLIECKEIQWVQLIGQLYFHYLKKLQPIRSSLGLEHWYKEAVSLVLYVNEG
jgi:hypothetical protein